ncbi:transcription initiation factor TFIID subunit 11 [Entomortierella parvispora]|uniref:Transcription initiation factor TFIID subunit 11 n=1 Tax=Entomortierella parvispora TaxID=205924 RepID=A0A9P3HGV4_9FUNG|nr:transcription initiation factor TFIID subunit 11 [Entomortierella parvispora]
MEDHTASSRRPVYSDTVAAAPIHSAVVPGLKKRKNAVAPSLPKPKKQKLRRNLDNIIARKELPNVPAAGGVNKSGQRMVKGPYKKREKKDKDGKKIQANAPAGTSQTGANGGLTETGSSGAAVAGVKARKGASTGVKVSNVSADNASMRAESNLTPQERAEHDGRTGLISESDAHAAPAEGGENAEVKDDEDDDHEEEPEYSEFEWNQEASSRGRSKDDLKALLDCFSEEQLQRYEVYRRSVLSRNTVKKLVGTILNQQVTQTMAFVVAGFCKVFVGEMVEKAREVMDDWGETGAIRPEHLREAQRRYRKSEVQHGTGVKTVSGYKRRLFCR